MAKITQIKNKISEKITKNIGKIYSKKIVTITIRGGIGNQLFQIATVLAYAWKYSLNPQFKKIKKSPSRVGTRSVYWNTVFRKIPGTERLPPKLVKFKEKDSIYHEIPSPDMIANLKKKNGIILYGYFQSAKYFDEYREKLCSFLYYIHPLEKKYLRKKYSEIFNSEKITIAMHIRRDDNITHPAPDISPYLWESNYYQKSIAHFQEKFGDEIKIVVISDDPSWCKIFMKNEFPKLNPLFPHEKDYLDLYLMSRCNHQIISNSSFSWWAAYFNNFPEKIVIAPKMWFGPKGSPRWDSIYMDKWIKF